MLMIMKCASVHNKERHLSQVYSEFWKYQYLEVSL